MCHNAILIGEIKLCETGFVSECTRRACFRRLDEKRSQTRVQINFVPQEHFSAYFNCSLTVLIESKQIIAKVRYLFITL